MANAFSLFGTIGVNTNPLKQGLAQAEQGLREFGSKMQTAGNETENLNGLVRDASGRLRDAQGRFVSAARAASEFGVETQGASRSLQGMNDRLEQMGSAMVGAGAALTASITVPLVALGGLATKSALDIEKLSSGLTAIMGSSKAAADEMERLREVAKLPGLGFKEAVAGSVALQGAGLSADLARRALQGFGNALATVGKGKSDLDGVILALGQIESKGKISAQEINQLAERVPQIRKVMQAAFGSGEAGQLEKMGISSTQFIQSVVTELEKLPPVATTASGQLENLGDTIDQALLPLGQRITALIAPAVAAITPAIEFLSKLFSALPIPMQYVVIALGAIAAAIGPLLVLFGTLAFSITSINTLLFQLGITSWAALTPILLAVGKVILIVGALAAIAYVAYKAYQTNFGGIKDIVDDAMSSVKDITMDVVRFIDRIISTGLAVVGALWARHGDFVMAQLNRIWTIVQTVFAQVTDYIGTAIDIIGKILTGDFAGALESARGFAQRTWDRIKTIFKTVLDYILATVSNVVPTLVGYWIRGMTALWSTIWNTLSKLPKLFLDAMTYVAKAVWEGIKALVKMVPQIPSMMINLGRAIINGIIDGIVSGSTYLWSAVQNAIKGAFTNASEAAKVPLTAVGTSAKQAGQDVGFLEGIINDLRASFSGLFEDAKNVASASKDVAGVLGGKGSGAGGGGGKSVAQAANEAADAIARTRMEILLYGKETRLAKFDTEAMAGAYSKWTDAQILFQRWQLFTLDLLDRTTKAIEAKKKAMDSLVESLKKAAEVDMGPIGDKIKGILPNVGPDGGPSIQDRRTPGDSGPMEPPPIAPWDTFFGKVREGMRKLKEELPSFKDQLANTVVGFVDMFGNAFANAVNQWDGTLKGFLNSLASTFRSFIKSVIAELMRLVAIRAATKIFELMGIGLGGARLPKGADPYFAGIGWQAKAAGGLITGPGSGTSDSIPTMLSNGEYVIPAASVRKFGVGFFEALRQGAMPFAMPTAMGTAGGQSNQTMNNSFNINVSGGGDAQKTGAMVQREILTALQKTQRRNR